MSSKIVINNRIEEEGCVLVDPKDQTVGYIENYLALLDARAQIKRARAKGYKILFRGEMLPLDENARFDFPEELFPKYGDLLEELLTPSK